MLPSRDENDEFAGRLDPPPTPEERARAVLNVLHGRPLKCEDPEEIERDRQLLDAYYDALRRDDPAATRRLLDELFGRPRRRKMFTRESLDRTLLLRGWAFSKLTSKTPLGQALDAFHEAVRAGDSPAAHRLLGEAKAAAIAMRSDWDWEPFFTLLARDIDALGSGQEKTEKWPPEIALLVALWMGGPPEEAELLTGLGFNLSALRRGERGAAQDALARTEDEADRDVEPLDELDHVLKAALYLAKGEVLPGGLRTRPLPEVVRKVKGRQRQEALGEIPQAIREEAKPRTQRTLSFEPYDPAVHDQGRDWLLQENTGDLLERIASLPPAQRRAVMIVIRAHQEGRELKQQCAQEGLAYKAVHEALRQARRALSS